MFQQQCATQARSIVTESVCGGVWWQFHPKNPDKQNIKNKKFSKILIHSVPLTSFLKHQFHFNILSKKVGVGGLYVNPL